jgi:hypothetical protein
MSTIKREWEWKGHKVIDYNFPDDQYYKIQTEKKTVILHHMASGQSAKGDINWWKSNKQRVATCIATQRNGDISTIFDSKYWAHALGVKIKDFDNLGVKRIFRKYDNGKIYVANNEILNEQAVQCELDSWGRLTKKGNSFYSWTNEKIDNGLVTKLDKPYKGQYYFESYTDKQLEVTRKLLIHWNEEYGIDTSYKGDRIFEVSKDALEGESGLWTHGSYRQDKDDVFPQPELIQMLKSI